MKKLSEFLKEKRAALNLTQNQLAELMGVSLNTVQSWESGKYKPQKNKLSDLAKHLDIDVNELETVFNDDGEDFSNFPFFMFTDEQNEIINKLRLTPEQKEFLMLVRIYHAERKNTSSGGFHSWDYDIMGSLRRIPYKYTEEKGVFRVYEFGLHLTTFLRYVPSKFCFEMIRNSPDTVFDLRTLDKKEILSWMDYCVFDKYYTQPRMSGILGTNYYSNLSRSISQFKEHTIERRYDSAYSFEKMNDMTLYEVSNNQYGRSTTIKLSEKGLMFQEWCKDIY